MGKYFITVKYKNWLAPKNGRWQNYTGIQTCNGFINMHPVEWLSKQHERQRQSWNAEKDHTEFKALMFYAPLEDSINTDDLQDLS